MKFIFNLLIIILFSLKVSAQDRVEITPLHKFFQKNADSTYMLGNYTDFSFNVLSRKADTISTYTYKQLTKVDQRILAFPKFIRDTFLERNANLIYSLPIDVNIFFNPHYLSTESLNEFWFSVNKLDLWKINDDKIDGEGCEIKQNKDGSYNLISDGGEIYLYLITKNEIKQLYFYAPDYYNEKCPGRKGRTAILELLKLFKANFQK